MPSNPTPISYPRYQGRWERELIVQFLKGLIVDGNVTLDFGDVRTPITDDPSAPRLILVPPRVHQLIAFFLREPSLVAGEAYMRGEWGLIEGRLADLLELVQRPPKTLIAKLFQWGVNGRGVRFFARQILYGRRDRRRTRQHYNISPDIFRTFLGDQMVYSCAFYKGEDDRLEDAQDNKLDTTIARLDVNADAAHDILDIGCGWGALTRKLAVGAERSRVVGISVAEEQVSHCRAAAAGLTNLDYHCIDYERFLHERPAAFDRIVSVGMFEHVGLGNHARFFRAVGKGLRPGGKALIHTIVKTRHAQSDAWTAKYIFPGGYVPCIYEVLKAVQDAGMDVTDVFLHDGIHYKRTARAWHERFSDAVAANRIDRSADFLRMMDFYLAGAQAVFGRPGPNQRVMQMVICAFE